MKTKNLFATILLGSCIFQACQNAGKNKDEALSSAADSTVEKNTITDTTGLNRGTSLNVFIISAAIGGMMEIEVSKIAQEKAGNPKVRDFAKMMVRDHTKISNNLKKLADSKGITLPASIPAADQAHLAAMKNMSGNAFDKHYMDMMVKDHIKTLDLFKSASVSGDTPIQDFAIKTLRKLETHYKMATELNNNLKH